MKVNALVGNTVQITGTFKAWSGGIADAENPRLNVYESGELKESIVLNDCKIATGTYQTYYVIPDVRKNLVFEMIGEVEGWPEVARATIVKVWT